MHSSIPTPRPDDMAFAISVAGVSLAAVSLAAVSLAAVSLAAVSLAAGRGHVPFAATRVPVAGVRVIAGARASAGYLKAGHLEVDCPIADCPIADCQIADGQFADGLECGAEAQKRPDTTLGPIGRALQQVRKVNLKVAVH
jgi:hypothetical protein